MNKLPLPFSDKLEEIIISFLEYYEKLIKSDYLKFIEIINVIFDYFQDSLNLIRVILINVYLFFRVESLHFLANFTTILFAHLKKKEFENDSELSILAKSFLLFAKLFFFENIKSFLNNEIKEELGKFTCEMSEISNSLDILFLAIELNLGTSEFASKLKMISSRINEISKFSDTRFSSYFFFYFLQKEKWRKLMLN